MGNEPNINIRVANLDGEYKNLARAADADGSGIIDSAYEHSLFTQYCESAQLDASDFDAKYTGQDTAKSKKTLVKEQHFKGGDKANIAELDEIEAEYQGALATALKMVGNQPEVRARIMQVVKDKPKMQKFTDMASFTAAMGQHIQAIANAAQVDLTEFIGAGFADVRADVAEVKEGVDKLTELSQKEFANLNEKIDAVTSFVIQDLMVDLEDLKIDKQDLQIDQRVLRYSQSILKNTQDIKSAVAQIKQLVMFDIMVDIDTNQIARADLAVDVNTNRVAHDDHRIDLDTNKTVHRTEHGVEKLTDEVISARQDIMDRIAKAEGHIIDETHRSADPLGINRKIADGIAWVKDKASSLGKGLIDFVTENPTLPITGLAGLTVKELADAGYFQ